MENSPAPLHLAIDLGASSGRVLAGRVLDSGIELEELHRFANGGVHLGKRLVWDRSCRYHDFNRTRRGSCSQRSSLSRSDGNYSGTAF